MNTALVVSSFYQFFSPPSGQLEELYAHLLELGAALELRGQIILAAEGLNGTVSGKIDSITGFKTRLIGLLSSLAEGAPAVGKIFYKDSFCGKHPFEQWTVKIRPEVVTSTLGPLDWSDHTPHYLNPTQWREMISTRADLNILDTRNDYEFQIGHFDNAIDPEIDSFREFENCVGRLGLPKDKPLLIYCTGGIRCEKAEPLLRKAGYTEVFQLHGGILNYLEHYPDDLFGGECFVFDGRVAVDQRLRPTSAYGFCPHCGQPASTEINCTRCGKAARICSQCLEDSGQPLLKLSCSKNCANLFSRAQRQR